MTPKLYKAAEVCEATGLQPYVLRSWEKEFPGIGVQKSADSVRLYRQSDVEQIRRIKQLVFGEGLTLAGARRRLEELSPRSARDTAPDDDEVLDTLGADARSRIDVVRTGLRSILEVLSKRAGSIPIPELSRNGSAGGAQTSPNGRNEERAATGRSARPGGRAQDTKGTRTAGAVKPARRAATTRTSAKVRNGKRKRTMGRI